MECVTYVCVWLGAVWMEGGDEWMRELGLGSTNPVGAGVDVCLCFGCGGVGGGVVRGLRLWSGAGGVVLRLDSLCRW